MYPRSLTLTPGLVISVHPSSLPTPTAFQSVRGLLACSASSVSILSFGTLGGQSTVLGEFAFSSGRTAIREMRVLEAAPMERLF